MADAMLGQRCVYLLFSDPTCFLMGHSSLLANAVSASGFHQRCSVMQRCRRAPCVTQLEARRHVPSELAGPELHASHAPYATLSFGTMHIDRAALPASLEA